MVIGPSGQRIVYAHGLGTPNGSAQQNPFAQPPQQSNAPVAQEYKALGHFPEAKLEKAFDIDYNELEGMTEIGRGYLLLFKLKTHSLVLLELFTEQNGEKFQWQ